MSIIEDERTLRLIEVLGRFIDPTEDYLSDSEWVYRLKKRFDLDWNRRQILTDVNE